MKPKRKRPLAIWRTAFPNQAKALRPENGKAGGVKARSGSEEARMAVYRPIAELFKSAYPLCWHCKRNTTSDVHHTKGRDGLLLFDIRYWQAVCRQCHTKIHNKQ